MSCPKYEKANTFGFALSPVIVMKKLKVYYFILQSDTEKARKIHEERINTRRKPSNLESEIEQILKQIKNQERM